MKVPWWIKDLANVIFPDTCPVCGRTLVTGEPVMCLHCLTNMPRTGLHKSDFNTLHQRIGHKTQIAKAASFFFYERDSDYTQLIYAVKYHSMPHIARKLGEMYAREIASDGFFDDIDLIEPVPLSYLKLLKRGYNQSEELAKGINSITGIPIGRHLKARNHTSQTLKNAQLRWDNASRVYHAVNTKQTPPRHALIVDDVITTGATMAACVDALRTIWPTTRISILTLGATRLA